MKSSPILICIYCNIFGELAQFILYYLYSSATKHYINLYLEGDSTILSRYEIILKQKEIALEQLEEAKRRVKFMEEKTKYYIEIIKQV